jgi:DNA-binding MarR family transcriptional regulator
MSEASAPATPAAAAAPAVNLLALDNQFCFALYSTSHAMTKTYKPLLDRLGLTYPQYLVMLVLWEQDDVLVKDIGARLFLDSGTLTPLLKRLEANGLLARIRDTVDERQVRIVLSEAGRALRARALEVPEQILCATRQPVPELGRLRDELANVRSELFKSADAAE